MPPRCCRYLASASLALLTAAPLQAVDGGAEPLNYRPAYGHLRDYRSTDRRLNVFTADSTRPVGGVDLDQTGGILDAAYDPDNRELYLLSLLDGHARVRRVAPGARPAQWDLPEYLMPQSVLFRAGGGVRLVAEDVRSGSLTRLFWRFRAAEALTEVTLPGKGTGTLQLRPLGSGSDRLLEYDARLGGAEAGRRRSALKSSTDWSPIRWESGTRTLVNTLERNTVRLTTSISPPSLDRAPMCSRLVNGYHRFDFSGSGETLVSVAGRGPLQVRQPAPAGGQRPVLGTEPALEDLFSPPAVETEVQALAAGSQFVAVELQPLDSFNPASTRPRRWRGSTALAGKRCGATRREGCWRGDWRAGRPLREP
jgi:hypothetical protein